MTLLIRHSRTEIKQRSPEPAGFAFADQVRWGASFKFLHLGEQPRADFLGLDQLLEFVVDALNFPQLRGVNGADWVALLPIHDGAVGSVHNIRQLVATPAQSRPQFGERALAFHRIVHFSQMILISFSSALNSGSPVTSSAFFSFA